MTAPKTEPKRRTAADWALGTIGRLIQQELNAGPLPVLQYCFEKAMAQARNEALEDATHIAELCGVDNDGHYVAKKIRALIEKEKENEKS